MKPTPDALIFPPSDQPPTHIAIFKSTLPAGQVFCERCQRVIALKDHAAPCPGQRG